MALTSISSLLWFAAIVALASAAGLALSRRLPWSPGAELAGLPVAVGLGLGPLLAGIATILSLWALAGRSHATHLAAVLAVLSAVWLVLRRSRADLPPRSAGREPWSLWQRTLLLVVAGFSIVLLANSLLLPLTQNDALEYALAGRALFEARSLAAYPVLDPAAVASGFYGPWTHPPLYTALVYITYVAQGHDLTPGLMRLVAPWSLLGAASVMYATGRLQSRDAGLLAAALTISVPLLHLGAAAALIDSMTVLGMALAFGGSAGLLAGTGGAAAFGLLIGLGLWTHSSAILMLALGPAALLGVWRYDVPGAALHRLAVALAAALAVGIWPYVRNTVILGSPISDNPPVFAFAPLAFGEYFQTQRGLSSPVEIVQYGIFKGLFAPEAYGGVFWLTLLGLVVYGIRLIGSGGVQAIAAGRPDRVELPWLLAALSVLVVYAAGVCVSVLLGIDLMIRNERYILMVLPAAALMAAGGLEILPVLVGKAVRWRDTFAGSVARYLWPVMWGSVLMLLAGTLLAVSIHPWNALALSAAKAWAPLDEKIRGWAAAPVLEHLRQHVPADAIVLSLKPADMYYARQRMISYADPRMIPFYRQTTAEAGNAELRALGITHVYSPDYSMPPLYNSVLETILSQREYAQLVSDSDGYQLYALAPGGPRDAVQPRRREVGPARVPWERVTHVVLGGRKSLFRFLPRIEPLPKDAESHSGRLFPLFLREQATSLRSPPIGIDASGREIGLAIELSGKAFVQAWIRELNAQGKQVSCRKLGETVVGKAQPHRLLDRRLIVAAETRSIVIVVEHRGRSRLRVGGVQMTGSVPAQGDRTVLSSADVSCLPQ